MARADNALSNPSKKKKRARPRPELPAIGGASVLRPGMNFAAITPRIP
jgi:hypothetical protein